MLVTYNTKKRQRETDELEGNTHSMICRRALQYVPCFTAKAYYQGEILNIKTTDILKTHKYLILFFYERDFTPQAVEDLRSIQSHFVEISANAFVLAVSVDTELVHKAFTELSHSSNGLGDIRLHFPLVADVTRMITNHFNILDEQTGSSKRAVFVIDSNTNNIVYTHELAQCTSYPMDTILSILA